MFEFTNGVGYYLECSDKDLTYEPQVLAEDESVLNEYGELVDVNLN